MVKSKLKTFISKHYPKILSVLFFTLLFAAYAKIFAIGSPYQPGATLDPACAPGDTNCFVQILPDQTGNNGKYLTTDGSTTTWSIIAPFVLSNGSGTTANSNAVDLGGPLAAPALISMSGNTFEISDSDVGILIDPHSIHTSYPHSTVLGDFRLNGNGTVLSVNDLDSKVYITNNLTNTFFGINTSAPTVALDVVGSINSSGIIKVDSGNISDVYIKDDLNMGRVGLFALTGTDFVLASTDLTKFYYGDNNLVVNGSNGNVGIGTSTPTKKFTVEAQTVGNAITSMSFDSGTLTLGGDMSGVSGVPLIDFKDTFTNQVATRMGYITNTGLTISNYTSGLSNPAVFIEHSIDENSLVLRYGIGGYGIPTHIGMGTFTPQSRLDISGGVGIGAYSGVNAAPSNGLIVSGNVGIGNSNPGYKLDVNGTTNIVGNITQGSGSTTTLGNGMIIDRDQNSQPRIFSSTQIVLQGNNSIAPQVAIKNAIGSTLNSSVLSVDIDNASGTGGLVIAEDITGRWAPSTGTQNMTKLLIDGEIDQSGSANGTVRGIYYNPQLTHMNGSHIAFENTTGNVLFGTTSGNVGIGTANPGSLLDVNGVFTFRGNILAGTDNTYDIGASGATRPRTGYFGTSVNVPLIQMGGTTSSFPEIKRNGTAINFRLADDSADAAITAGQVTTPLIIGGTGVTSTLILKSTTGIGTTGADIIFQVGNNGTTEAMRILNSGNVGIATSNPTQQFQIGTGLQIFQTGGTQGNIQAMSSQRLAIYGSSAQNIYMYGADSGTSQGPLRIANNSGEQLLKFDSIGGSTVLSVGANGGTHNGLVQTSRYGTLTLQGGNGDSDGTSTDIAGTNILINGGQPTGAGAGGQIIFQTAAAGTTGTTLRSLSEAMRILSNGNVGIGTSGPNYKLEVAGTFRASGNGLFGTNTSSGTTTPENVSLGGTYGSNTAGAVGNLKLDLYNDGTSNRSGFGISANKLEYQTPTSTVHSFYVGGNLIQSIDDNAVLIKSGLYSTSTYAQRIGDMITQSYASNNITMVDNGYYNGSSWTRIHTGYASGIQMYNGHLMMVAGATGTGTFTPTYPLKANSAGTVGIGGDGGNVANTFTGNTLVATSSGVGIGNASPNAKLEVTGNSIFTPSVTTGTGSTAGVQILANSLTSGNGLDVSSSSITSGNLVSFSSNTSSLAASNTQTILNISTSGSNPVNQTTYGGYFSNTHTGTNSVNTAIYATASGGSTNLAANFGAALLMSATTPCISMQLGTCGSSDNYVGRSGTSVTIQGSGQTTIAVGGTSYIDAVGSKVRLFTGGSGEVLVGTSTDSGTFSLQNSGNFYNSGNVGIQNTNPGFALHVGSSATTDSTTLLRLEDSNSTCDFNANAGGPTCGSDITLKKDITSLDNADILNKVSALNPVSYHWLTDESSANLQYGFIAQEVEAQFPNLVSEHTWIDGSTKKFLNMGGLVPYLASSIKELDIKVKGLSSLDITESNSLGSLIKQFLADVGNGIDNLFVKKIHTEEFCVKKSDGAEVCVTGDQLDHLLNGVIITPPPSTGDGGTTQGSGSSGNTVGGTTDTGGMPPPTSDTPPPDDNSTPPPSDPIQP